MYERFYDLRERPFSLSPDPDYLYPSRVHTEALSYLRYGLEGFAGFIVLTGEIGSGKTTLLQTVLRGLDHQTSVSRIVNTQLQPRELIEAVLLDFGLEARPDYGKPHLLRELARFLVAQRGAGRMALLVIDEAQNLALPTLEEVRMLSNLETEKSKLLQIVLVGQPSLRDTLGRPELEQLRQRVGVSYHLAALDAAETAAYIRHRVRRASIGAPVEFPPPVSELVHRHSGGLPRTINLIADAILLFAYGDGQHGLTVDLARATISELEATGVIAAVAGIPHVPAEPPPEPSPVQVGSTPGVPRTPAVINTPAAAPTMWLRPNDPTSVRQLQTAPVQPVMPPAPSTLPPAPLPPAPAPSAKPPAPAPTVKRATPAGQANRNRQPPRQVSPTIAPSAQPRRETTIERRPSTAEERFPAKTVAALGATLLAGVAVIAIALAGVRSIPETSRGLNEAANPSSSPVSPEASATGPVSATSSAGMPSSTPADPSAGGGGAVAARAPAGNLVLRAPRPTSINTQTRLERAARGSAVQPQPLRAPTLKPLSGAAAPGGRVPARPSFSLNEDSESVPATTRSVPPITAPVLQAPPVAPPAVGLTAAAAVPSPAAPPEEAAAASRTAPLGAATTSPTSAALSEDGSVQAVLNQYRHAYSRLDVTAARAVWPSVNRQALSRAFDRLESQEISFSSCEISLSGDRAVASCGGNARYVPRVGSQYVRSEPRQWTFDLRKRYDRWTISTVETR